jgi:hypothetical protein
VAEFPGAGLGQAGVDGVEHAGQLQGAQCPFQRAGLDDGGHGVNLRCADGGRPWRCWAAWRVTPSRAAI